MLGAALSLEHRTAWIPWAYPSVRGRPLKASMQKRYMLYIKGYCLFRLHFFFMLSFNFPGLRFSRGRTARRLTEESRSQEMMQEMEGGDLGGLRGEE